MYGSLLSLDKLLEIIGLSNTDLLEGFLYIFPKITKIQQFESILFCVFYKRSCIF